MKSTDCLTRVFGVLAVIGASAAEAGASETLTFREGDGGAYSSTYGATVSLSTGPDRSGPLLYAAGWGIDWYALAYLAFPEIIGTNPGQIPPGSTIESATLQLTREVDSDASSYVLLATSAWDESTISKDNNPLGTAGPGTVPAGPAGNYVIDVSSAVTGWAQGSGNWGFMLAVEASNDYHVQSYYSDDAPDLATRPLLTVTFSSGSVPVQASTWGRLKALYQ